MADRPLIGITLDYQEKGTFSQRPHYAVRTIYFAAVEAAGGLPIAIPHLADRLPEYMKLIDGLVIPGGTHASPESWYVDLNEPAPYEETPRAAFDIAVVEQALRPSSTQASDQVDTREEKRRGATRTKDPCITADRWPEGPTPPWAGVGRTTGSEAGAWWDHTGPCEPWPISGGWGWLPQTDACAPA